MGVRRVKWRSNGQEHAAWAASFYDEDGQRHRRQGFGTKREAEEWERDERDRLRLARQAPQVRADDMRFDQLGPEWLDSLLKGLHGRPPIEKGTWQDYELSVRL